MRKRVLITSICLWNIPRWHQCAHRTQSADKAAEAIEKGREHIRKNDPYQTFVIKKANLLLCLYRKDFAKAEEEYAAIEKLFKENTRLDNFTGDLYDTRLSYYKATGQRDKAMSLLHFLENEACYNCTAYLANSLKKQKADIYMENREYRLAAQEYRAYIEGKDTLNTKSLQNSVSEFNTILEVELLQKRKKYPADGGAEKTIIRHLSDYRLSGSAFSDRMDCMPSYLSFE